MKNKLRSVFTCSLLVFAATFFIQAGCSKSSDEVDTAPPPNAEEYVTWNINGNKGYLATPTDSVWVTTSYGPTLFIANTAPTASSSVGFLASTNATTTGTFPLSYITIYTGNKYYVSTSTAPQINIATFGSLGQFVTGSYTGMVKDSMSTATYSISGNFKIKRK
ncbi:MAG TPA: hypothetical protein VM888_09060 [Chitinophagaceae bacterium]|jgi:hypothetical protein|nr:hypothetical protein [Chitinophagaceae bacterium]